MEMYISLLMDRPIDENRHYISPGGFAFNFGGKVIEFDFTTSSRSYCKNPRMIEFVMSDLDITAFPEAKKLLSKTNLKDIRKIDECFVYTGENEEPSIYLERINNIKFSLDGEIYPVPERVLREYNIVLAGELKKIKEREIKKTEEVQELEPLPRKRMKGR